MVKSSMLVHVLRWMLSAVLFVWVAGPLQAQSPAPHASSRADCDKGRSAEPATPVEKGAVSGTKNMGATGWSGGGLGGSHNQPDAPGRTSSSAAHSETASGLDPIKSAREAAISPGACVN